MNRADGARAMGGVCLSQVAICVMAACATSVEGQSQFSVNRSADSPKIETVSVYGIFRNGRMSPGAWAEFGAALSRPFSQTACEAAYTNDLVNSNADLISAVDIYTKENGVSDELLDRFGARAKGDTIVVISMTGQPARATTDAGVGNASKPASAQSPTGQGNYGGSGAGPGGGRGMGRGGGGMGRGGFGGQLPSSASDSHARSERDVWEIAAWFFSVRLHHTVSEVSMTYSGQDSEDALKAFVDRLGAEMPDVACRGWDWSAPVDSASLRQMTEP